MVVVVVVVVVVAVVVVVVAVVAVVVIIVVVVVVVDVLPLQALGSFFGYGNFCGDFNEMCWLVKQHSLDLPHTQCQSPPGLLHF